MVRISKHPDKRKQDLIDAAERLFMTKGYQQTAISDIVREIDVAQGTFYYHFKSKVEILEEVAHKSVRSLVEGLRVVADAGDTGAVASLNDFFRTLFGFGHLNNELIDFIHRESNLMLHDKLAKVTMNRLVPLLSGIIQTGTEEGVFEVPYPVETATFLLLAIGELFHDPKLLSDPEKLKRTRITVEQSVARVLGIKEGCVRISI